MELMILRQFEKLRILCCKSVRHPSSANLSKSSCSLDRRLATHVLRWNMFGNISQHHTEDPDGKRENNKKSPLSTQRFAILGQMDEGRASSSRTGRPAFLRWTLACSSFLSCSMSSSLISMLSSSDSPREKRQPGMQNHMIEMVATFGNTI